jgi:hypothetical protein
MEGEKKQGRHASTDSAEVAEIFETLSSKLPAMINGILGSLFSVEAASNMGKSVAEFRKNLIEGPRGRGYGDDPRISGHSHQLV